MSVDRKRLKDMLWIEIFKAKLPSELKTFGPDDLRNNICLKKAFCNVISEFYKEIKFRVNKINIKAFALSIVIAVETKIYSQPMNDTQREHKEGLNDINSEDFRVDGLELNNEDIQQVNEVILKRAQNERISTTNTFLMRTVNGKSLHKLGYQIGAKRKFDEIDLPDRDISLYSDDLSLEKEFYTKISDCVLTIIKQEFESRSLEYKPLRN